MGTTFIIHENNYISLAFYRTSGRDVPLTLKCIHTSDLGTEVKKIIT